MSCLTGLKNIDVYIINFLDYKSICSFGLTCRYANDLISDDSFWINKILQLSPHLNIDIINKYKKHSYQKYFNRIRTPNFFIEFLVKDNRLDVMMVNAAAIARGVNTPRVNMVSDLMEVAREFGDIDMVRFLTSEYPCPEELNGKFIITAGQRGETEIVRYLAEKGYDIVHPWTLLAIFNERRRRNDQKGPRIPFSRNKLFGVTKYLIENNWVDINFRPSNHHNPALYYIAEIGEMEMVKYMIEKGANVNYLNHISGIKNLEIRNFLSSHIK